MKIYIILQDFREAYDEPRIAGSYTDENVAKAKLAEWEKENEDNCEEIRYLIEQELE